MPGKDEADLVAGTAAELTEGASFTDTFVTDLGGGAGTVEPTAHVPGKLLVEIDDEGGPFDLSGANKPARSDMLRHSVLMPVFDQGIRGVPGGFNAWFAGEIYLDAGAQRFSLEAGSGLGFFSLLNAEGGVLMSCTPGAICNVTMPAAGWVPLRAGWRRPNGSLGTFTLRWAAGAIDPLESVPPARLRTALHTAQLVGSRVDGFSLPRAFGPVDNATVIDTESPVELVWGGSLLGMSTSATYRSMTQLRVTEAGTYDFVLDGNGGSSYRLWLDAQWANDPAMFEYRSDATDPSAETISKMLSPGWHDVVLEAYDTRGDNGVVTVAFGKQGQATAAPALALTRPAMGIAPQVGVKQNLDPIQMVSGSPVVREIAVEGLATTNPAALGVDVMVNLRPRDWDGLMIHVTPPGSTTRIPMTFEISGLIDNTPGTLHASLRQDRFGLNDKAHGTWRIEITHPTTGGTLDATHRVTEVEMRVHYAAAAGSTAATQLVSTTSTYARVFVLDAERELRGIFPDAITPAGTSVSFSAQLCADDKGLSCAAAISNEQLKEEKPTAQYVKVIGTFTSDGFAVPILNKLALRYKKPD
jgi:hypothetical protein